MAIRFHLDEHIDSAVAWGLRRRGIEVSTTVDASLRGAADLEHIQYARAHNRVIYTNDPDFLRLDASKVRHCGIVFSSAGTRTVGQVIDHLALIHSCLTEEEMENHVEFF